MRFLRIHLCELPMAEDATNDQCFCPECGKTYALKRGIFGLYWKNVK